MKTLTYTQTPVINFVMPRVSVKNHLKNINSDLGKYVPKKVSHTFKSFMIIFTYQV